MTHSALPNGDWTSSPNTAGYSCMGKIKDPNCCVTRPHLFKRSIAETGLLDKDSISPNRLHLMFNIFKVTEEPSKNYASILRH